MVGTEEGAARDVEDVEGAGGVGDCFHLAGAGMGDCGGEKERGGDRDGGEDGGSLRSMGTGGIWRGRERGPVARLGSPHSLESRSRAARPMRIEPALKRPPPQKSCIGGRCGAGCVLYSARNRESSPKLAPSKAAKNSSSCGRKVKSLLHRWTSS